MFCWKRGPDHCQDLHGRPQERVSGEQGLRNHHRLAALLPPGRDVPQGEPLTAVHGFKGLPEESGPPSPFPSGEAGSRTRAQAPAGGCRYHSACTGGMGQPPFSFSSRRAESLAQHGLPNKTVSGTGRGCRFPSGQPVSQTRLPAGPAYLTDCRRDCRLSEEPTVG